MGDRGPTGCVRRTGTPAAKKLEKILGVVRAAGSSAAAGLGSEGLRGWVKLIGGHRRLIESASRSVSHRSLYRQPMHSPRLSNPDAQRTSG